MKEIEAAKPKPAPKPAPKKQALTQPTTSLEGLDVDIRDVLNSRAEADRELKGNN